jgi:hypothetical protein
MSEESEGWVPAAGRRRRLTLAPRPWTSLGDREQRAKVIALVYADFDGRDVSTADDDDDEWTERPADSSVDSWSASKVAWPAAMGSRFWALAAEDSSGEESSTEKDTCISNGMIKPGFAGATYVANNGVESE